ncbi:MAG: hypothetical protein H9W81_04305 [Enterococcus sp.]|nr:hypothetical protein [Enterococcus sp.]
MTTTLETPALSPESIRDSINRRRQLKYVTDLAKVIEFAGIEGNEVFPSQDTKLRGVARIAEGGIVFNRTLYMLPHTAAIACEVLYGEGWKPLNGWKYWSTVIEGKTVSLEELRDDYLDARMVNGDIVAD